MDLYKLKTFSTCAALLNFNAAAKHLNCAQSTVSAQIKSLETEVGAELFRRIKKTVVLTDAGEKLLAHAHKLLAIEAEALKDLSGRAELSGTIRLRVPEAVAMVWLPEILPAFLSQYPGINFDISNCSMGSLEHELQMGEADLALIMSQSVDSSNLKAEQIFRLKLVVAVHPDHPLAGIAGADAGHLKTHTVFLPKPGCGYGISFRQLLNTDIASPGAILELTSIQAIRACVAKGAGVTVLPRTVIQDDLEDGRLAAVDWKTELATPVIMVRHKDKRVSAALERFMNMARGNKKDKQ